MKNNKGFSLVELIVVIAIMAILAAVAIPTFATFINKANVASDVSFVNDLTYSAELAHAATGDEVKDVKVELEDGDIIAAEYTVVTREGAVKGVIRIENRVASVIPNTAASGYGGFALSATDAQVAVDTIDWNYKFKSKKDDAWQLDSTKENKELASATMTVVPEEEPDDATP